MTELGFASQVRDAIHAEQALARHSLAAAEGPTADAYVVFLAQMYVIDELLERAADVQSTSLIAGRFVAPELHRATAVASDLAWLAGDGWQEDLQITAATEAYVDRLREVAFTWPGGFIAHYLLRYLDAPNHGHRWALLDSAPWGAAERARVVEEVRRAVRLNAAVLAELARKQEPHRAA